MDDLGPGDGPSPLPESFTLTELTAVSDDCLSPVISKLVNRAVGKAFCGPEETNRQSAVEGGTSERSAHGAIDNSAVNLRPTQSTNQFNLQGTSSAAPPHRQYFSVTSDTDSTQVLLGINPLPEESELRVGPRASDVRRHTIPMESESVMGTYTKGLRIHRNRASVELENLQVDSNIRDIENEVVGGPIGRDPTVVGGLGDMFGGGSVFTPAGTSPAELKTLVDEMACQVAVMADDIQTYKGYFEQAYKTFSDLAKTTAAKITANVRDGSSGSDSSPHGEADRANVLPQEVRDLLLHTLSDIKRQLNTVKTRMKKVSS